MKYVKFLNAYKQNSLAKKKYYDITVYKSDKQLLQKFIELGLIKQAFILNKVSKLTRIYINYINNEKIYTSLFNRYTSGHKKHINIKTLKIKKHLFVNSTLLFSTSNGIMTNFEVLKKNISGILICQIHY